MKLQHYLKQFDRLAVALSGGADSACLLREAAAALGRERVLAITVQTELLPTRRLRMAKRMAELANVEHIILQAEALEEEGIRSNGPMQEYFYHRFIMRAVLDEAWVRGCEDIADGLHLDDIQRPAMQAGKELQIRSPFAECSMGGFQVAALRKGMGEDAAPGDGSLASRLPQGMPLTFEMLSRIDEAEEELFRLGLVTARVMVQGETAAIVVGEAEQERYRTLLERAHSIAGRAGFQIAAE